MLSGTSGTTIIVLEETNKFILFCFRVPAKRRDFVFNPPMTNLNDTPEILYNAPGDNIPSWLQVGFAMHAVQAVGLRVNQADELIFQKMINEEKKAQELSKPMLMARDEVDAAALRMKRRLKTVKLIRSYLLPDGSMIVDDLEKGKVATHNPKRISNHLAVKHPEVIPGHVKAAQRELRERREALKAATA